MTTRKRRRWPWIVAAVVLLSVAVVVMLPYIGVANAKSQFEQIKTGKTRAEVEAILGPPTRVYSAVIRGLMTDTDTPHTIMGWDNSGAHIRIVLDLENRVAHTHFTPFSFAEASRRQWTRLTGKRAPF